MDESTPYQHEIPFVTETPEWGALAPEFHTLTPAQLSIEEQRSVICLATKIILNNFQWGVKLTTPDSVRKHLQILLADQKDEVFCMLFLDSRHRTLAFEEFFHGTIDEASVHPRVIVRRALELNAAAGIMVHNHPSGVAEPSQADRSITERMKNAMNIFDVRIIDHIVVSSEETVSFAERGYL